MSGERTRRRLTALSEQLSARDQTIVGELDRLRLLSGAQLERLFFTATEQAATRSGLRRRTLGRLTRLGLLVVLPRRVGGVRAGSAGNVYRLSPEGQRLAQLLREEPITKPRSPYEPGSAYLAHTLAASETYVQLVEAERNGRCELLCHEAEPRCWRTYAGPLGRSLTLRPDAYVRLGVGDYEQHAFIEIDRGTTGSVRLTRKHEAYRDYYRSGREQHRWGLFPQVLWITTSPERVALLDRIAARFPAETARLFAAATAEGAIDSLLGTDHDNDQPATGGVLAEGGTR